MRFQPLRVNIKSRTTINQTDYNLDGYTAALDGYSYDEKNKAHFGGEGLVSTMNDFSKFCEMLVNGGIYGNERIITEEIKTTVTPSKNIEIVDNFDFIID